MAGSACRSSGFCFLNPTASCSPATHLVQRLHLLNPGIQLLWLASRVGHPAQRRLRAARSATAAAARLLRPQAQSYGCGVGLMECGLIQHRQPKEIRFAVWAWRRREGVRRAQGRHL